MALLRGVNVGGAGALPMQDLRAVCEAAGGRAVRTHGASGNAVVESEEPEEELRAALLSRPRPLMARRATSTRSGRLSR